MPKQPTAERLDTRLFPALRAATAMIPGLQGLSFQGIGDSDNLEKILTALLVSVRCPGDLILKTYDLARALRDGGIPVIGGFHSHMEKECLRLLLRGPQSVVICPARSIENMRIPEEWRRPLNEGRLLLLSPFSRSHRRPTVGLAATRNELVAALADRVFIGHAAPGGKTEAFAKTVAKSGKPLLTLASPANVNLVKLGARIIGQDHKLWE